MCGIVGYVGSTGTHKVLIEGLSRLEYRGYDSAGIAFLNGKGMEVYKTRGKIKDLERMLPHTVLPVRAGLGHTRWATHGAPSSANAHPHCAKGVAVVHNGIIENYRELRYRLQAEGCFFTSETDSEVIPQMIAKLLEEGCSPPDAIQQTVGRLQGSYALGILCDSCPDMLFAVRKGSPLVIGIGQAEYYFASDVPAILPYTRTYIFMKDGQVCTLTREGMELKYLDSPVALPLNEQIVEIDWPPDVAEKDGYDHFMLKEIHEQPRAIRNTVCEWIGRPQALLQELGMDRRTVARTNRFHIVACGTSYHAGLIGKYLIEHMARIPVDVDIASEYRYRNPIIENGTVFLSITQSGETADTLAAQREAASRGARTMTLCNVVGSTAAREADTVLYTRAGPEIGVASTKAFTAQLAALFLLAAALGLQRRSVALHDAQRLLSDLERISELIQKTLEMDPRIRQLAAIFSLTRDFLYLGRGISYPIAEEGALKLKEISYIHAEAYPAGEMKHGPIALIEDGVPVVVVALANCLFEKTLSNIEEVKARGGRVIAVTDSPEALAGKADETISLPPVHPLLSPFVSVVPLQLLAYHIGVLRKCDVDQPRNLAKSVTVE